MRGTPPINRIEVTEKSFVILFLRNAFIGDVQISEIKVCFSFKFLKFADRNILVKYHLTPLINRNLNKYQCQAVLDTGRVAKASRQVPTILWTNKKTSCRFNLDTFLFLFADNFLIFQS